MYYRGLITDLVAANSTSGSWRNTDWLYDRISKNGDRWTPAYSFVGVFRSSALLPQS